MKFNHHIIITDPEEFLRGDYHSCFGLYDTNKCLPDEWVDCGKIEFEINVDTKTLIEIAAAEIDQEIAAASTLLTMLERRKNELLSLEHVTNQR
jgi:hypothetical protein